MPNPIQYYQELLELYLDDACTPRQAEELFEFLRQDVSGRPLLQQMQNEFNGRIAQYKTIPPEISDRVRHSLRQLIEPPRLKPFYRKSFFWGAAAAVIISFSAGSYYVFFNKPVQQPAVVSIKDTLKNDVAPGGNKARLTLADGSSIVLDSAHDGALAQQGNTKVLKLNNGRLAYNQADTHGSEILYNTLTTPRGGQYELVLSDGTKVWLNAASSITFPTAFSGKQRKVAVTGEVYFEVAKNAAMPFIVSKKGDDAQVQVLGTHFNINTYDNEAGIRITLLEGSVDVSNKNEHSLLKPGQQAKITYEAIKIINGADMDEVMAWKNGRFYFDGTDIKAVMRQVERWYNVDVIYENDIKYSFVAKISRDVNVSKLLNILELTELVHFKVEGNKIIVTQ